MNNWTKITYEEAEQIRRERYTRIVSEIHDKFIEEINNDPNFLQNLEWRELERVIYNTLKGIGLDCELTPGSKDGGKDIIVKMDIRGTLDIYYIEIKHWDSKVGKGIVKHFYDVIIQDSAYQGLFLATNGYTSPAIEFIQDTKEVNLKLGDQNQIVRICSTYSKVKNGIFMEASALYDTIFNPNLDYLLKE